MTTKVAKKFIEKRQITLNEWFENISNKKKKDFLIKVSDLTECAVSTVYKWIQGTHLPKRFAREIIEMVAKRSFIYSRKLNS